MQVAGCFRHSGVQLNRKTGIYFFTPPFKAAENPIIEPGFLTPFIADL
jgi:hypothetical protein